MRKLCYYAHCMSIYDTPQETRDIELLRVLGFDVLNPNTPETQERCDALREEYGQGELTEGPRKNVMYEIFRPMVLGCDALAFRALPLSLGISSGAVKEIEWALLARIPVFELPSSLESRFMSLPATREYLREAGQR